MTDYTPFEAMGTDAEENGTPEVLREDEARRLEARRSLAENASVVIWTTPPWTIPANRAISYNDGVA